MKRDLEFFLSHTTPNGECLEWARCFNTDGYPRCSWNGNSNGKVHRIVWELANHKEAVDLIVRHSCDNPKCINPKHLLIGTVAENMLDRELRGRHGKAKITRDQVIEIRELYQTGKYTQKELGIKFGLNSRTISSLINRTHWKTV